MKKKTKKYISNSLVQALSVCFEKKFTNSSRVISRGQVNILSKNVLDAFFFFKSEIEE